ncbi:MAG: hypothetical protein KAS32_19545 [Candidatus Peribacteraceae bacterium]|nr:hypothetical protein [Candidatus Peribacteraceae bacterium]
MRKRFWITSDIPDPDEYLIKARPKYDNNLRVTIGGREMDFLLTGLSFTKAEPYEEQESIDYKIIKNRSEKVKENEIQLVDGDMENSLIEAWWNKIL